MFYHKVLVFILQIIMTLAPEPPPYGSDLIPLKLTMPQVKPNKPDQYLCTAKKIISDEAYIVQFAPLAASSRVHHMLLYGCASLPSSHTYPLHWECEQVECPNMTVIYGWAKDAKTMDLPSDVGFRVGPAVGIWYIVLQVHYVHPLQDGFTDSSGLLLQTASHRLKYTAGIYVLSNSYGTIPPNKQDVHLDANCPLGGTADIHPFAFRVHAHSLGTKIDGYVVSQKPHQPPSWTLIASGSPQKPQAFYPIKKEVTIHPSDFLVARCTYNSSSRNVSTEIGQASSNEMCNLYIMYYPNVTSGPSFYRCNRMTDIWLIPPSLPSGEELPLTSPSLHQEIPPNPVWSPKPPPSVTKKDFGLPTNDLLQQTLDPHFRYKALPKWGSPFTKEFGQITGVALDKHGNVMIFHRGSHVWNERSFNYYNRYQLIDEGPISQPAVVTLDPASGHPISHWGQNLFYLPHGLTYHQGQVWLTDVALQQVFRFPAEGAELPSFTLGEKFEPGNDIRHFCKPTSVAIDSAGYIYVADGYCNSRIVVFSPNGDYIRHWGQRTPLGSSSPPLGAFNIPHKLIITEARNGNQMACVADRENGRIQCSDLRGHSAFQIASELFNGHLYSIDYTPSKGGLLYAVCGPDILSTHHQVQAFVFNLTSRQLLAIFAPELPQIFEQPHDITVSPDLEDVFVVEIGPNVIWKFVNELPHKSSKKVLSEDVVEPPPSLLASSNHSGASSVQTGPNAAAAVPHQWSPSVVLALLGIPILLIILVAMAFRLRRGNQLGYVKGWLGGYSYHPVSPGPTQAKNFNLGNLLHRGFDPVALEDSEGGESEVEEFASQGAHKA